WLRQYNEQRPHESLGNLTPAEYLALYDKEVSTIQWH
ncbi:MAG: integrase core domain-containing protein, partial [Desulfarculaceae bacterium]